MVAASSSTKTPDASLSTRSDGRRSPGLKNIEEVVAALQAHERTMPRDGSTLLAWGFDPIYFTGRRMNLADLDKVSTERPVIEIGRAHV